MGDHTPSKTLTTISGALYPPTLTPYALPLPALLALHPTISSIAAGAFIFHPHRGLLLIRRAANESAFPGYWEVPGGGMEAPDIDATLLDAVVREVKEETGLSVGEVVRCYGCVEFDGRSGRRWRKWNFEVKVGEGEEVVLEESEHDGVMWVGAWEEVVAEGCRMSEKMEEAVRMALGIWQAERRGEVAVM